MDGLEVLRQRKTPGQEEDFLFLLRFFWVQLTIRIILKWSVYIQFNKFFLMNLNIILKIVMSALHANKTLRVSRLTWHETLFSPPNRCKESKTRLTNYLLMHKNLPALELVSYCRPDFIKNRIYFPITVTSHVESRLFLILRGSERFVTGEVDLSAKANFITSPLALCARNLGVRIESRIAA